MRMSTIALLTAILSTSAVAIAKPDTKKPDPSTPDDDNVSITMVAGKGRLGVSVIQISPELRAYFGAPGDRGVLVDSVRPDSPAAKAGVRVGDILTDVDGAAAKSATDILDAMSARKKGDAVPMAALRKGQRVELRATLEDDAGPAWHGGRPQMHFERFFDDGTFDHFNSNEMRKQLEDMQKRLEKLEHIQRS
jgi:membrane-associated protease RseP (regulator of RpoE activity)